MLETIKKERKMKKYLFLVAIAMLGFSTTATAAKKKDKEKEGFKFTTIKENPITSVKNQNRSSTCWSFSGLAFFESELLRMNKGEYDLSEMFVVHETMVDRAVNYVRLHGDSSFSPGGSFYDVLYAMKMYGIVPQSAMPGIEYGEKLPVHSELDAVAGGYINAIAKGKLTKLTPVWKEGLNAIYDTYLGKCPTNFEYEGVDYTPKSFEKHLGLNLDDYVSITSYSHHPFYTQFPLLIQDNWRMARSYNIPLEDMLVVMNASIEKGYTFAWGSDVSESGFTRDGVAVFPDIEDKDNAGSDKDHWLGLRDSEKAKELSVKPSKEVEVTQALRQKAYDNWQTTDDHGMLIYGLSKDQNGKKYFMVKNSWGTDNKYKGTWYASEAFVAYKTMNILINKEAIPADIRKKMGL